MYERFCHEVVVAGDLGASDDLVHRDVVSHFPFAGTVRGREGFKQAFAQLREAFADIRVAIQAILADGDRAAGHFKVSGVERGALLGIAATSRTVEYDEMVVARLTRGQVAELTLIADTSALAALQPADAGHLGRAAAFAPRPSEAQQLRVRAFFSDYADRFNRALRGEQIDPEAAARAFARYFVGAGPSGVRGSRNGMLLRWIIPRGFARYRKIGTRQMELAGVAVEPLDEQHALAKVHWDSRYIKKDGERVRIEFDVTYLLHFEHGTPKIFAYIAGDEERVLREHGLV